MESQHITTFAFFVFGFNRMGILDVLALFLEMLSLHHELLDFEIFLGQVGCEALVKAAV
jgi:hypothetical protein